MLVSLWWKPHGRVQRDHYSGKSLPEIYLKVFEFVLLIGKYEHHCCNFIYVCKYDHKKYAVVFRNLALYKISGSFTLQFVHLLKKAVLKSNSDVLICPSISYNYINTNQHGLIPKSPTGHCPNPFPSICNPPTVLRWKFIIKLYAHFISVYICTF